MSAKRNGRVECAGSSRNLARGVENQKPAAKIVDFDPPPLLPSNRGAL